MKIIQTIYREILFRAKRNEDGSWVYGSFVKDPIGDFIQYFTTDKRVKAGIYVDTLGQYTGLTDKNGIKIFEGDIVEMPAYGGGKHITNVYFKNGKFAVDGSRYHFKDIGAGTMKVIGNIYDNPELIEENK